MSTSKKRIVHLLGKGDGWEDIINAGPGKIYGVNDAFLRTPNVAITFHMHNLKDFYEADSTHSSTKLCIEYLDDHPDMEFYTVKRWSKIPRAKEYPLQEVIDHFGVCYFTSTIEYMIAYALWKGVDVLNFYGINMTVKQEYIEQKPGVEYWMGRAQGMGVEVNIQPKYSSLLKTKNGLLYGYNMKQWMV